MAKITYGGEDTPDFEAVFVDTNLDTHLAIPVSFDDTVFDLKRKILAEHSKCFVEFGEVEVLGLKVECEGKLYTLSDFMPVRSVFARTNSSWFIFADISSKSGHHETDKHNTKILADPYVRMLAPASLLQGGYEKDERNLQTDKLSGEARSETLQLVAEFNNDDNVKSSSSDTDKRLNAIVEDICKVTVSRSGLLTEATSANQVGKSSDVGSFEKNKPKKKRKIAANVNSLIENGAVEIGSVDKHSASQKLEIMKNLDQNVDDGKHCDRFDTSVESAGQHKREDKCSEISDFKSLSFDFYNKSGAEIEQTVGPHGGGDKIPESHGRNTQEGLIGNDKTKGTAKEKNKRMTKVEAISDKTFASIDASDNVSAKSHAMPVDAIEGCSSKNVGVLDVRDSEKEATTFGAAVESGMRRSKKRKNGGDDVSHQVDTKRNEELGVPDIGDKESQAKVHAELPELGMTRPLKRKKTGDDFPDVIKMDGVGDEETARSNSKQQTQTQKSKKKTKQKQTPAVKNITELMGDQSDTMETENSKSTWSKPAVDKDNNGSLFLACAQTDKVAPMVTSEADIVTTTKICVDEEVLPVKDEKNSMKHESTAGKDDEMELASSFQEKIDKATDANADIEMRNAKGGGVGDIVILMNHDSDLIPQKEADETMPYDAEPLQLTPVQKSEKDDGSKSKKLKKKIKKKQSHPSKSISELSVEDQNNSIKLERSKSSLSRSEGEKAVMGSLSSPVGQIDNVSLISVPRADVEVSTKTKVDEVMIKNHGSDASLQQEADDTCQNDAEPLSSSFQEKIDKAASVADANADIEMRNAKGGGVDDKVILMNHDSDVIPQKEADETMPYDAELLQLTQFQKSGKDNGSKSKKSKKKIKQKQSHPSKSISELSVEDQNNSIKHERSKSTLSRSEVEKADLGSLSSPIEQMDNVSMLSIPQADVEVSTKAQVDGVMITNHGSDACLQQEADDTCQNGVEPIQPTQAQRTRVDTENKSVQTKKKAKQQTRKGKTLPKVVEGEQEDATNDISLEKDRKFAPVEVPLNAAKNKRSEKKTTSGSKHLRKSTADPVKVESSALKTKDSGSLLNGITSTRVGNGNDSVTSTSNSGILKKRPRQGKATEELPKLKQRQSNLSKSSNKSTQKVVHKPSNKKSLISKSSSIFKDESSSSAETEDGGDASDSSTKIPYDDHGSSDYSEDESRGSWASPKHGNSKDGGVASPSKSMQTELTMDTILRSSRKYKKAKLVASQLQLEDDESQPVDIVPDSQANP